MKKVLIAFDIDGTLRSNFEDQTKAPVANEDIRTLRFKNVKILVWSGGGELYSRQVVASLGLTKYVDQYADKEYTAGPDPDKHYFATKIKPDIAIDDIQACELGVYNLICKMK